MCVNRTEHGLVAKMAQWWSITLALMMLQAPLRSTADWILVVTHSNDLWYQLDEIQGDNSPCYVDLPPLTTQPITPSTTVAPTTTPSTTKTTTILSTSATATTTRPTPAPTTTAPTASTSPIQRSVKKRSILRMLITLTIIRFVRHNSSLRL